MRTFIKNIALRLNMTRAENTPFLCNAELNRIMDEEETNNLLTGSGTKDEIRAATHRALDEPFAGMRPVRHPVVGGRYIPAAADEDTQMRFGNDGKSLEELELEALHVEALHEDAVFDMMRSGGNTALIQELIASGKPVAVDIPEIEGRNPTLDLSLIHI